jgi:hypothetical protein
VRINSKKNEVGGLQQNPQLIEFQSLRDLQTLQVILHLRMCMMSEGRR